MAPRRPAPRDPEDRSYPSRFAGADSPRDAVAVRHRHRRDAEHPHRNRRKVAVTATVTAAALGAAAFLVYGGLGSSSHTPVSAGGPTQGPMLPDACDGHTITVAASPDIAPVVTTLLAGLPAPTSGCPGAFVEPETAQQVVQDSTVTSVHSPDIWIPDSTLRLTAAASTLGAGDPYPVTGTPLAVTPVVVAVPKPLVDAKNWTSKPPDWGTLLNCINDHTLPSFTISPPQTTTEGLLGVLAISTAMSAANPDPQMAAMETFAFRNNITDGDTPAAALYAKLSQESDPQKALTDVGAFVSTEQALWAYDNGSGGAPRPSVPYVPVYPAPVTAEADYPAVLSHNVTATPDGALRANTVLQKLTSATAVAAFTHAGFRSAGRAAPTTVNGVSFATGYSPPATAAPGVADEIGQVITQWVAYQPVPFRALVLVDGSGSMNDVVPGTGGKTKADILRSAGLLTTQLFGNSTEIGVREFDTNQVAPWTDIVPLGPMSDPMTVPGVQNATRRDAILAALTQYQATPGSGTPLYKSILDAVQYMHDNYQSGALNEVFVLTDGRDGDSNYGMTQPAFLSALQGIEDPGHPVPVFSIGYGSDADMPLLSATAQASGGLAAASSDPSDLVKAIAQILTTVRPSDGSRPPGLDG